MNCIVLELFPRETRDGDVLRNAIYNSCSIKKKPKKVQQGSTTPTTSGQYSASDSYDASGRPETTQLTKLLFILGGGSTVCVLHGSTTVLTSREVEKEPFSSTGKGNDKANLAGTNQGFDYTFK